MAVVEPEELAWFEHVLAVLNDHIRRLTALSEERTRGIRGQMRAAAEELPADGSDLFGAAQALRSFRETRAGVDEVSRRLRRFVLQAERPYFGRFDFQSAEDPAADSYYIGIGGVTADGEPLIYDWRTPVASLYYDAEPGPAEYQAPAGVIRGQLIKKRQYVIRHGQLLGTFDTTLPIGDEVLTAELARASDAQMTSIVATIQREQNHIIRAPRGHLAVEGPAGSGKTSVALQRIAYLLYRYRTSLPAREILFISPSHLFRDYIAGVLPELGEENPTSATWGDLVRQVFPDMPVESWVDAAERSVAASSAGVEPAHGAKSPASLARVSREPALDDPERRLAWKSSLAFLDHLERHAASLTVGGLPFRPLRLGEIELVRPALFTRWFYRDFASYPVSQRWDDITERLQSHIKRGERQVRERLRAQLEPLATDGAMLKRQVDSRLAPLMRDLSEVVAQAGYVDFVEAYRALYRGPRPPELSATEWQHMARVNLSQLARGPVPYEDLGGLLWLRLRLGPGVSVSPVQEIFVDEAQDYTPCQLAALGRLFREARLTLVGDPFQSVYSGYGLEDFGVGLEAFRARGGRGVEVRRLDTSYRSSPAIMTLAEALLPETHGTVRVLALARHDRPPRLFESGGDASDWLRILTHLVRQASDQGHGRIGVLTRTRQEAVETARLLEFCGAVAVVDPDTQLHTGVLVMPIVLAKGLEFDTVIVADATRWPTTRLSDRKLLYTAATRAIHELWIVSRGPRPAGWPPI